MTRPSKEYAETDLTLPAALSYKEYEAKCATVGTMARANRWWIGSLIVHGTDKFGEKAYQALEALGLAERTLTKCARVYETVAPERRRSRLSWDHHETVAALTPAQQDTWLLKAEKDKLSRAKLRKALREAGLVARRVRIPPEGEDLWTRVRRALDLLKAARDRLEGLPWSPEEVKALVEALEEALYTEPMARPSIDPGANLNG